MGGSPQLGVSNGSSRPARRNEACALTQSGLVILTPLFNLKFNAQTKFYLYLTYILNFNKIYILNKVTLRIFFKIT